MKLSRWVLPIVIALILIAVALVGARSKQSVNAQTFTCVDPVRGCTFTHRGETVHLRFSQQPNPLQAFTMTVRTSNARQVHAEFQMLGMDMGFNRYDLRSVAPNQFSAQVSLPACVTGRRDWKLYLHIDKQRYMMPFSTS